MLDGMHNLSTGFAGKRLLVESMPLHENPASVEVGIFQAQIMRSLRCRGMAKKNFVRAVDKCPRRGPEFLFERRDACRSGVIANRPPPAPPECQTDKHRERHGNRQECLDKRELKWCSRGRRALRGGRVAL